MGGFLESLSPCCAAAAAGEARDIRQPPSLVFEQEDERHRRNARAARLVSVLGDAPHVREIVFARLHYVHRNPVHHGLVRAATAYPWCSAAWFETEAPASFRKTV